MSNTVLNVSTSLLLLINNLKGYSNLSFLANQPRARTGSWTEAAEGAGQNPAEEEERRQKQILNHFILQRTDIMLCKLKMKYSIGTRSSMAIDQYSWEIAGKLYPTQPIELSNTNYSQGYANVLDCLGQIGNVAHNTLVTTDTTNTLFYNSTQATAQKFVAGLVLEDFNSANNASTYSGANLSTVGQMSFRPRLGTAASGAYRVDFFTSCDMSIHITFDGRMYTVR